MDLLVQVGNNAQNYTQQNDVNAEVPTGPHLEQNQRCLLGPPYENKQYILGDCVEI